MNFNFLFSCTFIFSLACFTHCDDQEKLKAELTIAGLELQDDCENLANAYKSSLKSNSLKNRILAQDQHANLTKIHFNLFKEFVNVEEEDHRAWSLFTHPGDGILPEAEWHDLMTFHANNTKLTRTIKINCDKTNTECQYLKNEYDDFLQNSNNETLLKKSWSAWQLLLGANKKKFPKILDLVTKATILNEKHSARLYWEMLIEQENAYEKADALWQRVEPLYLKLHNFVKVRLQSKYSIPDRIPVYLLGSNFGNDWSAIAADILPNRQAHYDAETFLKKLTTQEVLKIGEGLTMSVFLQNFGENFWKKSVFNSTFCDNDIISFCASEFSEIITCSKTSWTRYLDLFETSMNIGLLNKDYETLSIQNLRYSAIDEAIISLGSTLGIKNLEQNGLLHFTGLDKNTELLLTALRILPQLPFYHIADKWRLDLLENGFENAEERWWNLRKSIQRVEGVTNSESDFLNDDYITTNKPYLRKLISERSSKNWITNMVDVYSIYEVSADALLEYFKPLEEYLDTAPLKQEPITTTEEPTTIAKQKQNIVEQSTTIVVVKSTTNSAPFSHHTLGPEPHRHFHEDLQEGNNPTMEKMSLWIGFALLSGIAVVVIFAVVTKKIKKRKQNNRRFET